MHSMKVSFNWKDFTFCFLIIGTALYLASPLIGLYFWDTDEVDWFLGDSALDHVFLSRLLLRTLASSVSHSPILDQIILVSLFGFLCIVVYILMKGLLSNRLLGFLSVIIIMSLYSNLDNLYTYGHAYCYLSFIFIILSAWLFWRYMRTNNTRLFGYALFAMISGMISKENAIFIPLFFSIMLFIDTLKKRKLKDIRFYRDIGILIAAFITIFLLFEPIREPSDDYKGQLFSLITNVYPQLVANGVATIFGLANERSFSFLYTNPSWVHLIIPLFFIVSLIFLLIRYPSGFSAQTLYLLLFGLLSILPLVGLATIYPSYYLNQYRNYLIFHIVLVGLFLLFLRWIVNKPGKLIALVLLVVLLVFSGWLYLHACNAFKSMMCSPAQRAALVHQVITDYRDKCDDKLAPIIYGYNENSVLWVVEYLLERYGYDFCNQQPCDYAIISRWAVMRQRSWTRDSTKPIASYTIDYSGRLVDDKGGLFEYLRNADGNRTPLNYRFDLNMGLIIPYPKIIASYELEPDTQMVVFGEPNPKFAVFIDNSLQGILFDNSELSFDNFWESSDVFPYRLYSKAKSICAQYPNRTERIPEPLRLELCEEPCFYRFIDSNITLADVMDQAVVPFNILYASNPILDIEDQIEFTIAISNPGNLCSLVVIEDLNHSIRVTSHRIPSLLALQELTLWDDLLYIMTRIEDKHYWLILDIKMARESRVSTLKLFIQRDEQAIPVFRTFIEPGEGDDRRGSSR